MLRPRIFSNMRRQPLGDMRGSSPSITSSRASAFQRMLPSKMIYFLPGAAAVPLLLPEPRMALKKSDDGSTTMTSLFLLKLAL